MTGVGLVVNERTGEVVGWSSIVTGKRQDLRASRETVIVFPVNASTRRRKVAAVMPNRRNPYTAIGRPTYEGPHLMPFDLPGRAMQHEFNRQRVVTALLLNLHILAVKKITPQNSLLSWRGAISQSLEGHDGNQAAHCAPRQILIFSQTPSEILSKVFPERAYVIDCLFAETDILPANFNRADSRAERHGLNDGFLRACQWVVNTGQHAENMLANLLISAVQEAYSIYKKAAAVAFRESLAELDGKINSPVGVSQKLARWKEQREITEYYQKTLRDSPGHTKALNIDVIAGLIKVYSDI